MKIKGLTVFDFSKIISNTNYKVLDFIFKYEITNKKDVNNLFLFYCFLEILEIYKNNNGLIIFYIQQNDVDSLIKDNSEIKYKSFINLLIKKIKFPILMGTLSFNSFCSILKTDCPEYDEIIDSYQFLPSFFDKVIKIVKSKKFYQIEREYINNFKNTFKLFNINKKYE